jgi:hypothetical protein
MSAIITSFAITAVGVGFSAYSQYQQGKAQEGINNRNAAVEDQNAMVTARDGAILANATRRQNARVLARQRAGFAANGVVGDTGSPLLTEVQQSGYLEMGALETERTADIRAGQYRQQAALDRMAGRAARAAGGINSAATVLQGAGNLAGGYARYSGIN